VGLNARMIFTPEDRAEQVPEREMDKARRDGQANDERWHLRRSGDRFFAVGRLVALKDRAGHIYGFAKILRDATPYRSLEEALRLSEEQYRLTFTQAPLGMMVVDLNGRILQANAALCRLLRRTEEELRGRKAISLTVPADRPRLAEQMHRMFATEGATFVLEKQMERADASPVWVQNSGAILRDGEGRPVSVIDLCQDITPLKLSRDEMEQLVQQRTSALRDKTKQMESFCYTVAHDLRAPLRAIAGYAEILAIDYAATLDAAAMEYLEKIATAAGRLDRLIQDLLGYTRVQQIPLTREQVDLAVIIDRVIGQLQRDVELAGATIEVRRPLGVVGADPPTLDHVFLNLISNALKFRREDVPLRIQIRAEDHDQRVRVWVQDNGVGIDPRFAERVFRMFERVHDDRKYSGTGVGLAIVATALDRLGGSYGVEPNPEGGSRFWVEFPK
jgi:PAS domain S-box-containing protein